MILLLALTGASSAQQGFEDHLAQAEFFAHKGWFVDAWAELQRASELPGGEESFALHRLSAEVAWELLDIEGLVAAAGRAEALAPDEDQRLGLRDLREGIERGFGFVEIRGPHEGLSSRLQLDPQDPQLDPELKRFVQKLSLRLRDRQPLPVRVGLPVGRYLVNGEEIVVLPGQTASVELPMRALGTRGLAALQVVRSELSLGVGQILAGTIDPGSPSPVVGLGLTVPLGPVLVGLVVSAQLSSARAPGGAALGLTPTAEAGLRVGRELVLWGPLSLRPSLLYRVGTQTGLELDCQGWESEDWRCTLAREASTAAAAVQTTSVAHRPGVELALDWRQAGRTTAIGTGVRLVVDQGFGSVPEQGEAALADGSLIRWTSAANPWTATRVQMLTSFSFAF